MKTTLIDTEQLAGLLDSPQLALLDCRFDIARSAWGEQAYLEGHLPGARYAHLDRDLSGPVSAATGRHPLPDPDALALRFGAWGVAEHSQIVAYDQGSGAFAARLWWLARWLGHEAVAVLDGGIEAWRAEGRPLESAVPPDATRTFRRREPLTTALSTREVIEALAADRLRLVDARAADRFAGRNETVDPVAGHVPGAVNHPFSSNLDARGRFLDREALRERWLRTLAGRSPTETAAMCGSGVTACHDLLALEHAGLRGARLYGGSWSEWIRDLSRPVATGEK
jgi:thiosulfate/3-mercaptopyruvate sulfurtransferase